jgi:hypothetical protein
MRLNENQKQLLESSLLLHENLGVEIGVYLAQRTVVGQKVNISSAVKAMRRQLADAQSKQDCDRVIRTAQNNIKGVKRFWERNTKSVAKPIKNMKESTFNKFIADCEDIIKQAEAKKKTLKK